MAAGLNKVTIIGNLGRDPEMRYTQSGTPVCNLRVGVTERRNKGETEGWQDHTEWFTVACFGKTAENAGRYLKKGRQVYVDGRLQTRIWEDREGGKRHSFEIVANQVLFLGSGSKEGAESTGNAFAGSSDFRPVSAPSNEFEPPSGFVDEDIPF